MTETETSSNAPWHVWVVGGVSLLWNAFGVYDFIMTVTQGETYWRASGMPQPLVDYYLAMPSWMYGPWILGVWGAILGSVLLLARSRFAVTALGVSLFGAVASLLFGIAHPMPELPPELAFMRYMSHLIVLIAALLFWYAWSMRKRFVLR
jgi:hypothetical protein